MPLETFPRSLSDGQPSPHVLPLPTYFSVLSLLFIPPPSYSFLFTHPFPLLAVGILKTVP